MAVAGDRGATPLGRLHLDWNGPALRITGPGGATSSDPIRASPTGGERFPPCQTHRAGVFGRLAVWSQRHRWGTLLLWVLAVAVVAVGARSAGSAYRNDFTLPGTGSQAAAKR
ncbi:hypothetical protein GCM10010234_17720 [Streptomyces hawaiiensis]